MTDLVTEVDREGRQRELSTRSATERIAGLKLMVTGQASKADRRGRVLTAVRDYLTNPDMQAGHQTTRRDEFNAGFESALREIRHDLLRLLDEDEVALARVEAGVKP